MFYNNQTIGGRGERIAARYLQLRLYRIVARNYRTPFGEIDLVCRRKKMLIFVEVKTRTNTRFGNPETAITPRKISHIIRAGEHFRRQYGASQPWRIDVLAVTMSADGRYGVQHFENAIQDWVGEIATRG